MTASLDLLGVNLTGAAYGTGAAWERLGHNYVYPTRDEIDYYASKDLNVVRLSVLWERLQPQLNGALDGTQLRLMDEVVSYAHAKGMSVVLDLHNYGMRDGKLVGAEVPNAAFANLWGKLAAHYAPDPDVLFGLMNEPHEQSAAQWLQSTNAAIAAIRSAGATSQEILVSGAHWDGAWNWTTTDNAAVFGRGVVDPSGNYAFEVHQYFDTWSTGTVYGPVRPEVGAERLRAITEWAEAGDHRLFLGEFGATTEAGNLAALDGMLRYMGEHADVWQGATYFAGGPWVDASYPFSIEPEKVRGEFVDRPQMDVLERYAGGGGGAFGITALLADRAEGAAGTSTPFTFTVSRDGAGGAASLRYELRAGGTDGSDFVGGVLPSGRLDFAAGERSRVVTVMVAGDDRVEGNESFGVAITGLGGAEIDPARAVAYGVIRNDDAAPRPAPTPTPVPAPPPGGNGNNAGGSGSGTAGADLMDRSASAAAVWLSGQDGNDTLRGGAAGDALSGGDGDDVLQGNGGNDWLVGGAGADRLTGGAGDDTFVFNRGDLPRWGFDQITDFGGAGAPGGDVIRFGGFGPGATLVRGSAAYDGFLYDVMIGGASQGHLLVTGTAGTPLAPGDYLFT